ncbi:molybdopterin-guanine dinucleotide biosynthesis protein B [Alkalihalobacillus hwajinpoensis]|uniref:molybdopterin-guanine dinucleotide biosynthesis protein B n=1 Tax=Guptibacillus hwajinpoensis TaxID=208199 RepID=UPI00188352E3|nr:molybdopterin-guanine dinucleotide biosynthesis protein B [Pseudalkalibacillus hwajinpoensis]MBF0708169.1 molybdopterin-guanine dinucleotide biosynthesis protein B [Pseudalkalibacillus hwajinpoensis]
MSLPILQVIGYQNSGKTLFAEKFIEMATSAGRKVGVIKHHGHGAPDVSDQNKDTGRHREAGATVTGVSGGGMVSVQATQENEWDLNQLIRLYEMFDVDLILIEGYKEESYPKVAIIRDAEDLHLLEKSHIIGSIVKEQLDVPVKNSYQYDEMDRCINDVLKVLRRD